LLKFPCSCRRQTADHALASAATGKFFRERCYHPDSRPQLFSSGLLEQTQTLLFNLKRPLTRLNGMKLGEGILPKQTIA
jgi:hypothetical protein